MLAAACTLVWASLTTKANTLGPGAGPWVRAILQPFFFGGVRVFPRSKHSFFFFTLHSFKVLESPEHHGLSSAKLKLAADRVKRIRERYCFVVIKDGALVHESYFANSTDTV